MTAFGMRARLGTLLFAATLAGGPSAAAPPQGPGRVTALQKLADCRKVPEPDKRLACYDDAAATFDQAEAKGDIVVVDREKVRKVRRQAFGFTLPSLALFDRGDKPEQVDEVTLAIEGARQDGGGKWTVVLEGGQVWRQIDTAEFTRDPRPGMTATIRRAMMGSYMMTVGNGHAAIRVHRDN
jgi:hypothetical protein